MEILGVLVIVLYCYLGDTANYYLKYHVLNARSEFYADTGEYIISRLTWAVLLGWITIPIALLHNIFLNKGD